MQGTCQKKPPVVASDGSAYWPMMDDDDWCGDFTAGKVVAQGVRGTCSLCRFFEPKPDTNATEKVVTG